MVVSKASVINYKAESGFKYKDRCKYYDDMANSKLEILEYDFFTPKTEEIQPRIGVPYSLTDANETGTLSIDFDKTKKIKFLNRANGQQFYCVFFQYGSPGLNKDFKFYAEFILEDLIKMINENIPIIFFGHSQGSATVISVLNELCRHKGINFSNIYGVTLGLGKLSTPVVDLFEDNYRKFNFNYIDLINLASINNDTTTILNDTLVKRKDNYPIYPSNEYELDEDISDLDKPERCMDNFLENITLYSSSCNPYVVDSPYFCRNMSKGMYGMPVKQPWYNKIKDDYRMGSNNISNPQNRDYINSRYELWKRFLTLDKSYNPEMRQKIYRLNDECMTDIEENKRNWGDYNSEKYNKCEELFKIFHRHININNYGFLLNSDDKMTIFRIDKENILKKLILDDHMDDTGKIYYLRVDDKISPLTYIYNEENNKMLCQSNTYTDKDAHSIKSYRGLFLE